ncbi:MAG: S-layer homology domain-containing protein, partial [Oscillospiraceae bacterium]|nr:S-layer homology domain-containing protein [Oscillospiraceae bacterium]
MSKSSAIFSRSALLLTLVLLVMVLFASSAGAASYTDTANHYAYNAIEEWTSFGVLAGDGNYFRPNDPITRASFASMISRTFQLEESAKNPFADVSINDWYYDAVMKCVAAGIFVGDNSRFYPNDAMPREQAIAVLARAFRIPDFADGTAQFTDANLISPWARAAVGGMARKNLVAGYAGKVMPQDTLRRADALILVNNLVNCYLSVGNTSYNKTVTGRTVIAASGVTIHDVTLNGDVFVTQGVGSGTVTFNNVIINGDLYVNGGGTNSVLLRGRSRANGIYIHTVSATGPVRVSLQDDSECEAVYAEAQSQNIYLEGMLNRVSVASDTRVYIDRGTVKEVELNGIRSEVRVNSNSTVKLVTSNADHANLYAAGTVERVLVNPESVGTIIEAGRTGVITDVTTWADDVQVIGAGKVSFVFVRDGDNVRVTVEGALVYVDADAGRVITGDGLNDYIDSGNEGVVGSGDMEHALNVSSVSLDSDGSVIVDFSKAPDKTKAGSVANYTLSGDGVNYTVNKATHPTYAEVSGNTVRLTFRGAKFGTMNAGESIIISVANLTGSDGSPLGVASGIYRIASNDANLLPGSMLEDIAVELLDESTVSWTGNTTYPGVITDKKTLDEISIPLKVTLPVRLAESPTLVIKRSAAASKIKYTIAGRAASAPTVASQYDKSKLTNMEKIFDGDRIYIQVTAPDGKTTKYYKITVTVVDHLRLTDISREGSSSKILRFSFDQIDSDKEDHIRFAEYSDNVNAVTGTGDAINWIPLRMGSGGQGYLLLDLDKPEHQAIIASLSSQTYIHSGKNVNGTITRTKIPVSQVGIGRNQETSDNLRDDKIYFTTWEQGILKVYGLQPLDYYIVELKRTPSGGGAKVSDNNVLQSGPSGILSLDSPTGVTDVSIRRIDPVGSNNGPAIEQQLVLGDPIAIENFTLNLNSISGPYISIPSKAQRALGWRIRIGNFAFTSVHLDYTDVVGSETTTPTVPFKRFGIDSLADSLQTGTYFVSSNKYDDTNSIVKTSTGNSNISTRFVPTVKIVPSPTTTAARFIDVGKILFQLPSNPGSVTAIISDGSAGDQSSVDSGTNKAENVYVSATWNTFINGKIELTTGRMTGTGENITLTGLVPLYNDNKARSAYLVTSEPNESFSLTKAISVNPWLYEP